MKAQRWATETKFADGTTRLSIYTPTGRYLATREFRTEAQRVAVVARYDLGAIHPNN